jgi:MYXO-CTERM domain-containing protein
MIVGDVGGVKPWRHARPFRQESLLMPSRSRCAAACLSLALTGLFAAPARAATKVACVGDSITRGAGTTVGGYAALLGKMLGAAYQVGKFGNSGSTMMKSPTDSYWNAPEFTAAKAFAPDIVVIMLGTNDAKGAWVPADGPHHFESDYRAMLAELAALPSKPKMYLVWPPPMLRPSLKANETILKTQVIPIISKIAADSGSGLAKVHDAFLPDPTKYFGTGDGTDIADGLHPNDVGAQRIADTIFCALRPGTTPPGGARCSGAPPPPPRDAGAEVGAAQDATADLATGGDVAGDTIQASDALARLDMGPAEPDADPPAPRDSGAGGQGGGGAGGQGGASPVPEPEPIPTAHKASGCAVAPAAAGPSLLAMAAGVAIVLVRRRRAPK